MPSIRADQIQKTLKSSNLPAITLVSGDEPLQVQETCDQIKKIAAEQDFNEREQYHTDSGFSWETLFHITNSLSLFAEKKLIEIHVHNGKCDEKASKAIIEFIESQNTDTSVLLIFPKIDKRTQNSKWYKAIEQHGLAINIWPITQSQLPRWLDDRLKKNGLRADSDALSLLAAKVEGNLLAAAQEIEKLKLTVPDQSVIDAQTMAQAVISSARYDVYGLVDKALTGHARAAADNLQGLKAEGMEPPVILWALTREIRTLALMKEYLNQGKPFDLAAKSAGVWSTRKTIVKQALQRVSLNQLYKLLRKANIADKIVKGVVRDDPWNLLLDMTLDLANVHSLNNKSERRLFQH